MDAPIIVGIDIGTTKICTLVASVNEAGRLRILGVGIEPSNGMRKGTVVDVNAVVQAVARSIEKAERTSGLEIESALVSLAGSHISSENSRGVVGVSGRTIESEDVARVIEASRAVTIPHNQEMIHVIQRGFVVDGQDGIRLPVGMHGYRLEAETHVITASAAAVENLRKVVESAGAGVGQFVLNPLASAEVVLSDEEREMGVVVCDIGGGTTDMAIYINGDVWHTMVLAVGGNHITSDIAHGLHLPISQAEEIKLKHGHALQSQVGEEEAFYVHPFGDENTAQIHRRELAYIIEARVEEIFSLVMREIKRSGYDSLLPAGMVLTGGVSALPGIRQLAKRVLEIPVQVVRPEGLVGMVDQLHSPAYSTSVGLLQWAVLMSEFGDLHSSRRGIRLGGDVNWGKLQDWLRRLLP